MGRSRVAGAFAAIVLGLSVPAYAGALRGPIMDLLNAYEEPVRAADLEALGAGVDVELMAIADDTSVPSTRRGRAVTALQYYKTDAVRGFLEKHLAATGGDALLRRKAAGSLGVFGEAAVTPLTSALGDADVQLRIAAAQALGRVGNDAAKTALSARAQVETEPAVKSAIASALGGR